MRTTLVVVALAHLCGCTAKPPTYAVTLEPLTVGTGQICLAIDEHDADHLWWWQPGRSGCNTRSTDPLFKNKARVGFSSSGGTDIQWNHRQYGTVRSFAFHLEGGFFYSPATGQRVAMVERARLDVPMGY